MNTEAIPSLAEQNQRAIARALDHSTVIVRRMDGCIEHWTAGCESLYGWSAADAVGRLVHDLLKTRFPAPVAMLQKQLRESGSWTGELELVRRDGHAVFVSTNWVLSRDERSGTELIIETHTDITARLQIQRELESVNERLQSMALELERSNEDLEEFARIASHDLAAPITSTRWLVDLLASRHGEKLDASGRECIVQIQEGLNRMAELVEAVLEHARAGRNAISVAEEIHAEDALSLAVDNLQHDIEVAGLVLDVRELPCVRVEPQALTRLFQNLLSNAIKYRKQDTAPHVQIQAEWQDRWWVFSVQDNGIGIEPEWHDRIFKPMQRRHGIDIAGSGIGLATCRKIVLRAGGRIWVQSQPGCGATFLFSLPGRPPQPSA